MVQEQLIMVVLFAGGDPIPLDKLAAVLSLDIGRAKELVDNLSHRMDNEDGAFVILRLGDSYQLAVNPKYTPVVTEIFGMMRNQPLSQAAMEVLAVVAFNQPVTKAYIEDVRGVDSAAVVNTLVSRGLVEEAGRLEIPGRPMSFKTTAHFLRTFELESLSQLMEISLENLSAEVEETPLPSDDEEESDE